MESCLWLNPMAGCAAVSERRFNPLTGEWLIVSPGRLQRPWQGEVSPPVAGAGASWSSDCYLCPRVTRASGAGNPDYSDVFVFENDYPALDETVAHGGGDDLIRAEPATGRCRVLCYDPRHNVTLADLETDRIERVIDCWRAEYELLADQFDWVQIFENKGRMMGCSSEHPHGQVWATCHVPTIPANEDQRQRDYRQIHGTNLLLDYVRQEVELNQRVVVANESWVVVVPYWAAWPFETMVLPTSALSDFAGVSRRQATDLAHALKQLLTGYDRLFGVSMPYSMGWHGRARGQGEYWQLHGHFYPPLLRSSVVRKFMVGFEMLAEAQRDLTPEAAADLLRQRTTRG